MEVIISAPAMNSKFDSTCSSPYISPPLSPTRFGEYYSAPTSPTRLSSFYGEFNNFSFRDYSSDISFNWEEKENPEKPKSNNTSNEEHDFEFNFSENLPKVVPLTADVLFDGGKIRPLKPPPRLQIVNGIEENESNKNSRSSPKSPRSPFSKGKKIIREAFSPRKRVDFDPFEVAATIEQNRIGTERERGRERVISSLSSNPSRRGTRSLSPFRVSDCSWEEKQSTIPTSLNSKEISSSSSSSSSSGKGYRKWRLKDFLLFRSASEGRASDKDPLRKFSIFSKKNEDVKHLSFRSAGSSGSVSGRVSDPRRKGLVSAHEVHYTVNRAVAEQMKRKTFLPYKKFLFWGA